MKVMTRGSQRDRDAVRRYCGKVACSVLASAGVVERPGRRWFRRVEHDVMRSAKGDEQYITNRASAESRLGSRHRPTSLEIPQDSKAGGGCCKVLECMSAQDESNRIDCVIVEFTQFGECVEHRGDQPVRCA